jgi:hypothetical protein
MTLERLSSRQVYRNRWMTVREDSIRRQDGSTGLYGVVCKPDFSLIIPYEAGAFHLVEQYRYPVEGRQSAESLLPTLEGVHEEVRRMVRVVADPHEPRLRWPLALASAATLGTLLFALVRLASVSQPPSAPPAPLRYALPTAPGTSDFRASLAGTTPPGQPVLTRPLPKEPFKGQKRPPCTRYTEVELVGACWMPHELKAPCPEDLFEYQGKCFVPSFSAKPPPSSLGQ